MHIVVYEEENEQRSPIKLADAIIKYCRDAYGAECYDLIACEIAEHIQVYFKYKSLRDSCLRGDVRV
jgi:hypothetical protein